MEKAKMLINSSGVDLPHVARVGLGYPPVDHERLARLAADDPAGFCREREALVAEVLALHQTRHADLGSFQEAIDHLRLISVSPNSTFSKLTDALVDHLEALKGAVSQLKAILNEKSNGS